MKETYGIIISPTCRTDQNRQECQEIVGAYIKAAEAIMKEKFPDAGVGFRLGRFTGSIYCSDEKRDEVYREACRIAKNYRVQITKTPPPAVNLGNAPRL